MPTSLLTFITCLELSKTPAPSVSSLQTLQARLNALEKVALYATSAAVE